MIGAGPALRFLGMWLPQLRTYGMGSERIDAVGTSTECSKKLMRYGDIRTTMNIHVDAASADMREADDKVVKLALTA
jgi:hypothetical protein